MSMDVFPRFNYQPEDRYFPIPPAERGLQTVIPQFFAEIPDSGILQGLHFDRTGRYLYLVNTGIIHKLDDDSMKVMRLDMETKECVTILHTPNCYLSDLKIHKDGRLFLGCTAKDFKNGGGIYYCNPDGTGLTLIPDTEKWIVDFMVFSRRGGFYFSDFKGYSHGVMPGTTPEGGVYYMHPDFKTVTPIMCNMAGPNGLALSPDEKVLFVSESYAGRLLRFELADDGLSVVPCGSCVCYHFTGQFCPDSLHNDIDNNIYCALYYQGRAMVFNTNGWPIGQILLPGRERGLNMCSTHCAIRPGTKELYIATSGISGEPSSLWTCGAFAEENPNYFGYL